MSNLWKLKGVVIAVHVALTINAILLTIIGILVAQIIMTEIHQDQMTTIKTVVDADLRTLATSRVPSILPYQL